MTQSRQSASVGHSARWIEGRFLDGGLDLILTPGVEPGAGYALALHDTRIWRNGEYVGDCHRLQYDRNALGWWVHYVTWPGSPLDMKARSEASDPAPGSVSTESQSSQRGLSGT